MLITLILLLEWLSGSDDVNVVIASNVYVNDVLCLLCLISHLYYLCHFRILLV